MARLLDTLALAFLLLAVVVAVRTYTSRNDRLPVPIVELAGRSIDLSDIGVKQTEPYQTSQSPVLLYAFLTTCAACERQREHIRTLLIGARTRVSVVAVSPEPDSLLHNYWDGVLPDPISIKSSLQSTLGISEVPTILLVDSSGLAVRAYKGRFTAWSVAMLQDTLDLIAEPSGTNLTRRQP